MSKFYHPLATAFHDPSIGRWWPVWLQDASRSIVDALSSHRQLNLSIRMWHRITWQSHHRRSFGSVAQQQQHCATSSPHTGDAGELTVHSGVHCAKLGVQWMLSASSSSQQRQNRVARLGEKAPTGLLSAAVGALKFVFGALLLFETLATTGGRLVMAAKSVSAMLNL